MKTKEDAEDSSEDMLVLHRWGLKRIAAILAIVGALVGTVSGATGWYTAKIQQDTQDHIWQDQTEQRLDTLEKAQKLDYVRGSRNEIMMELMLRKQGITPPEKNDEQIRAELEADLLP